MDGVVVAATVVIACSAIASLCVTWRLSEDNRALRKAATEPNVVAYLDVAAGYYGPEQYQARETYTDIVVAFANVGESPARNVAASSNSDLHELADSHATAPNGRIVNLLPPGQTHNYRLGLLDTLVNPDPMKPFDVEVVWKDLGGRSYLKKYELDVSQFAFIPIIGSEPIPPIPTTLRAIAQDLHRLVSRLESKSDDGSK